MVDINQNTIERLLQDRAKPYYNEALSCVNILVEYANHVSTMEEKLKSYPKNSGMYSYMAKELDKQRREKHDNALYCLNELNRIAAEQGLSAAYPGNLDSDISRNDAADAIYEFCKHYLTR